MGHIYYQFSFLCPLSLSSHHSMFFILTLSKFPSLKCTSSVGYIPITQNIEGWNPNHFSLRYHHAMHYVTRNTFYMDCTSVPAQHRYILYAVLAVFDVQFQ